MTVYLCQLIADYGFGDRDITNLGIVSDIETVQELRNKFEDEYGFYEFVVQEFILDSLDLSKII